jgi:hypothetical protein
MSDALIQDNISILCYNEQSCMHYSSVLWTWMIWSTTRFHSAAIQSKTAKLQKIVQSQSSMEQNELLRRIRDKPFWIWDQEQHKQEDLKTRGDCCFNHIVGLPRMDGKTEKPMFDYEKLLYDSLLIPEFYNLSQHTFSFCSFSF